MLTDRVAVFGTKHVNLERKIKIGNENEVIKCHQTKINFIFRGQVKYGCKVKYAQRVTFAKRVIF